MMLCDEDNLKFCLSTVFQKWKWSATLLNLLIVWIRTEYAHLRLLGSLKILLWLEIFFYFTIIIIIASILLRCNSDALTLTSAAKEKENVIAWLEEYLSFLFPILLQYSILIKSRIDYAQKKKKYIYYFCVSSLVRKMIWRLGPGPWVFEPTKEEVYPCTFFRLHFVKYGEKWNKYVKRKISWQLCFLHNFNYDR